jgi:hypothetical protein
MPDIVVVPLPSHLNFNRVELQTSQRNWNKNARSNVNYQDNMLFDLKKDGAKELLTDK